MAGIRSLLTKEVRTYPADDLTDGLMDGQREVLTDNLMAIILFNKRKLAALKVADFTIFA